MGHIGRSVVAVALVGCSAVYAQTTAFTYQGQLSDGGAPASGSYDLRFALFDTTAGGAQIGANQTVAAVPVSDGAFSVQLDFGVNAFPGANRFLEIGVKPAGGGSYTTLAPRQQISSSPYAIRTLSAATADALSSACIGCVTNAQIAGVAGSKVSGAIPIASLPSGSGNYVQNTTAQQTNANFNIAGNGVIGGNLTVAGTLNANVSGNFIQNRTTEQDDANFNINGDGTLAGTLYAGNASIGTTTSTHRLGISGGPSWTSAFWSGAVELDNASAIAWHANSSGNRFGIGATNGGLNFFTTASDPGRIGSPSRTALLIDDAGNLRIAGDEFVSGNAYFGQQGRQMLNLFGTGFGIGIQTATLYSRSGGGFAWHVGGTHTDNFYDSGGGTTLMTLDGTRGLDFGSRLGQHLSLWGSDGPRRFGFGIQAETLYARVGNGAGDGFAWYKGGAHTDGHRNPGGGQTLMTLDEENGLAIAGNAVQAFDRTGFPKAMLLINGDGNLLRCYNGVTGASTDGCGFQTGRLFNSGYYYALFPFPVADRFYTASVDGGGCCSAVSVHVGPRGDEGQLGDPDLWLKIVVRDSDDNLTDRPVTVIVY